MPATNQNSLTETEILLQYYHMSNQDKSMELHVGLQSLLVYTEFNIIHRSDTAWPMT